MTCPICSEELTITDLIVCTNIPEELKKQVCIFHLHEVINTIKKVQSDGYVQITRMK